MCLLEWNEEQYCWYKYRQGLEYLRVYLFGDAHAISIIERSPVFWGWWKNHFTIREEEYLQHTQELENMPISKRAAAYVKLHDAKMLAEEMNPTSQMLGDSYATMIQQLIKLQKKETV